MRDKKQSLVISQILFPDKLKMKQTRKQLVKDCEKKVMELIRKFPVLAWTKQQTKLWNFSLDRIRMNGFSDDITKGMKDLSLKKLKYIKVELNKLSKELKKTCKQ